MTNAPMIQRRAGRIPAGATGTAGADRLDRVRALDAVRGEAPKGLRVYPGFSRRDLDATAPPEVLAEARRLAPEVEDLDWDEHSVWARLGDYGLGISCSTTGFGLWQASARAMITDTDACACTSLRSHLRTSATALI
jgi:hypothetical protein